jgi:hypothetical protein
MSRTHISGSSPRTSYLRVAYTEEEKARHDAEIARLVSQYKSAPLSEKPVIQGRLMDELYASFDLGIVAREAEVRKISAEIERMRNDDQYDDSQQSLQVLEEALKTVQTTLIYRKLNRDRIVAQRLDELI